MNHQVEDALNTIAKLTNESGNLKEFRNSIHEKVSELRNLIYTIKGNLHEKIVKMLNYKMRLTKWRNQRKNKGTRRHTDN